MPVESEIMLEHNVANEDMKQEADEGFEMALQEHKLNPSYPDSFEKVIKSTLNKMDYAGDHTSQLKTEVGVDTGHRLHNLKQETEAVKFNFEPVKKEVNDSCDSIHNGLKDDIDDKIHYITFKQEPEYLQIQVDIPEQYLSENCSHVQGAKDSLSDEVGFASEYNPQVKSEVGFDDDPEECNLKQGPVKCDIKQPKNDIGSEFKSKYKGNLESHIEYKHNKGGKESPEIYQCQFCECKYEFKHSLQRHIKYKHNENAKWYQCSFCDYKSKRKDCLTSHLKQHNANREIYRCQFCEHETKYERALKKHINERHYNEIGKESPEIYQCQFCEYRTMYKYVLKRHFNFKHNENPKWFQCSFCDYKTKRELDLRNHFQVQHDETSEVHYCQFCEYKSKSESSLRKHIDYKHSAQTYQCQFCEGKFKNRSDLKRHIKCMHDKNVEWYHCDYCNLKTKYRYHLKNHLRAKHDRNYT